MPSPAGRLEDEEGLLLIFAARQEELFWPSFGPCQTEETTVKGQTKTAVQGGGGLQTCQSVLVLSESNPDFLGNDYLRWMISASGLK